MPGSEASEINSPLRKPGFLLRRNDNSMKLEYPSIPGLVLFGGYPFMQ